MIYLFFAIVAIVVCVVVWKVSDNRRVLKKVYPVYLEERRRKEELLNICKQMRGEAWFQMKKETWPEFVIHGEKIKAPDRKGRYSQIQQVTQVMPEYCPKNGKQCFDNRGDAERAARQFMHRNNTRGVMSVYRCDICKCFHVTSYGYNCSRNIREMNKSKRKK